MIRVHLIAPGLASVHYQPSWLWHLIGSEEYDRLAIGPAPWCWSEGGVRCHDAVQDAIADELRREAMCQRLDGLVRQ